MLHRYKVLLFYAALAVAAFDLYALNRYADSSPRGLCDVQIVAGSRLPPLPEK